MLNQEKNQEHQGESHDNNVSSKDTVTISMNSVERVNTAFREVKSEINNLKEYADSNQSLDGALNIPVTEHSKAAEQGQQGGQNVSQPPKPPQLPPLPQQGQQNQVGDNQMQQDQGGQETMPENQSEFHRQMQQYQLEFSKQIPQNEDELEAMCQQYPSGYYQKGRYPVMKDGKMQDINYREGYYLWGRGEYGEPLMVYYPREDCTEVPGYGLVPNGYVEYYNQMRQGQGEQGAVPQPPQPPQPPQLPPLPTPPLQQGQQNQVEGNQMQQDQVGPGEIPYDEIAYKDWLRDRGEPEKGQKIKPIWEYTPLKYFDGGRREIPGNLMRLFQEGYYEWRKSENGWDRLIRYPRECCTEIPGIGIIPWYRAKYYKQLEPEEERKKRKEERKQKREQELDNRPSIFGIFDWPDMVDEMYKSSDEEEKIAKEHPPEVVYEVPPNAYSEENLQTTDQSPPPQGKQNQAKGIYSGSSGATSKRSRQRAEFSLDEFPNKKSIQEYEREKYALGYDESEQYQYKDDQGGALDDDEGYMSCEDDQEALPRKKGSSYKKKLKRGGRYKRASSSNDEENMLCEDDQEETSKGRKRSRKCGLFEIPTIPNKKAKKNEEKKLMPCAGAYELTEDGTLILKIANSGLGTEFMRVKEIKKVVWANSVPLSERYVRRAEFKDCSCLTEFDFTGVKAILNWAFDGCENLTLKTSNDLSADSLGIGERAFCGCKNIGTEINFNGSNIIGKQAFKGATSLQKISLNGPAVINEQAFEGATGLKEAYFKGSVTIGKQAFKGDTGLQKIFFNGPAAGQPAIINAQAFEGATSLEEVHFRGLVAIGSRAFQGIKSLQRIYLDESVTVESDSFKDCGKLEFYFETGDEKSCGELMLKFDLLESKDDAEESYSSNDNCDTYDSDYRSEVREFNREKDIRFFYKDRGKYVEAKYLEKPKEEE